LLGTALDRWPAGEEWVSRPSRNRELACVHACACIRHQNLTTRRSDVVALASDPDTWRDLSDPTHFTVTRPRWVSRDMEAWKRLRIVSAPHSTNCTSTSPMKLRDIPLEGAGCRLIELAVEGRSLLPSSLRIRAHAGLPTRSMPPWTKATVVGASESKLGRVVTRFPAHIHETKYLQMVLASFTDL